MFNLGNTLSKEELKRIMGGGTDEEEAPPEDGGQGSCGDKCEKGSTCKKCSGCDPDSSGKKYVCTSHA